MINYFTDEQIHQVHLKVCADEGSVAYPLNRLEFTNLRRICNIAVNLVAEPAIKVTKATQGTG